VLLARPWCQAPWLSLVPRSVATVPDPMAYGLAAGYAGALTS
jgi:hypothetical protein